MNNPWIFNAWRQLQLASLWRSCRRLLESVDRAKADLVEREVLAPFLDQEWLPGIRQFVQARLPSLWTASADPVEDALSRPHQVFSSFLAVPRKRRQPVDPADVGQLWEDAVRAAFKRTPPRLDVKAVIEAENEFQGECLIPPVMDGEQAWEAWISQAQAIACWEENAEELRPLLDARESQVRFFELSRKCQRMTVLVASRGWWAKVTAFIQNPGELDLLVEMRGLLEECHEALAEAAGEAASPQNPWNGLCIAVPTIDALIASWSCWPPTWLASLPKALGVKSTRWPAALRDAAEAVGSCPPIPALPGISDEARSRLEAARAGFLAALSLSAAPDWTSLQGLISEFLKTDGVQVRVLPTGKPIDEGLPSECYEEVFESGALSPRGNRAGLVLWLDGRYVCVVPARRSRPLPGRAEVEQLEAAGLVEGEWKSSYGELEQLLIAGPIMREKLVDVGPRLLKQLVAFHIESKKRGADAASRFAKQLTMAIFRFLSEKDVAVQPQLDPRGLPFITAALPESCAVEWERSANGPGIVKRWPGFGTEFLPGGWVVCCGENVADETLARLNLPFPPSLSVGEGSQAIVPEPLIEWRRLLQLEVLGKEPEGKAAEQWDRVEQWLAEGIGADWFDCLMHQGVPGNADAKSRWAEFLGRSLGCFPRLENGQWTWPNDADQLASGLVWTCHDEVPFGTVLGPVDRYAIRPEMARCTLSLGRPTAPDGLYYAQHLLRQMTQPVWNDEIRDLVQRLFEASRIEKLRGPCPDPKACLEALLEALLRLASAKAAEEGVIVESVPHELASHLDNLLQLLRGWANACETGISPRDWQFQEPITALTAAENKVAATEFAAAKYHVVVLRRFGVEKVADGGPPTCKVVRSAGPAPDGHPQLLDCLSRVGDAATALRDAVAAWPVRRLEGESALRNAGSGLFERYWTYRGSCPSGEMETALAMEKPLRTLLLNELGMRVREPKGEDYKQDQWVKVVAERPGGSPTITKVVRPALFDKNDACVVPAHVELN